MPGTAADLLPERLSVQSLREAARGCQACPLWESGTQTVFGEGRSQADVMFVGEQPGDKEDLAGHPFVGPAGRLLDRALEEAGIPRGDTYLTNVVKHFKWEARGKRRIHKKPNMQEINACRPWLDAELTVVKPKVVVCLGATAAQALLGRDFRLTRRHGELLSTDFAPLATATIHPSSVLRAPDGESRREQMEILVEDLAGVARRIDARSI